MFMLAYYCRKYYKNIYFIVRIFRNYFLEEITLFQLVSFEKCL